MKLKEAIHHSVDGLDNNTLAWLYDQIQQFQQSRHTPALALSVPSIEDVLRLTGSSPDSWSDDVLAHRGERV